MTGKRKVANLLALAVLSYLSQQPMHRSWALGNSEHCAVGGPERSWVTWSGGMPREGVAVFRRVRGCRGSWRDPPSLRTRPARGRSGVALTA
jgi:hypothetical protein